MSASLVGSEMCIRDRSLCFRRWPRSRAHADTPLRGPWAAIARHAPRSRACLLYTSDAADDM
eukprot:11237174-Alexandrium_andersonii.AAC.1